MRRKVLSRPVVTLPRGHLWTDCRSNRKMAVTVLKTDSGQAGMTVKRQLHVFVIPASEACRESFLKNDSGQAGMTVKRQLHVFVIPASEASRKSFLKNDSRQAGKTE